MTRPRSPGACTKLSMDLSRWRLQREIAFGLALLGAAQHGVELIDGFARHEGAQQRDRGADHRQIHVKIGARIAEQRTDVGARQHDRIDLHALPGELVKARTNGVIDAVADQAADHEGVRAAVEHRLDQFDRFGLRR